jgi:hypothetical protein
MMESVVMRTFVISVLILVAVALNCQALNPISLSQESGMAILANLNANSSALPALQNNSTQNQTNQTGNFSEDDEGGLWSWGKIPIGYELSKNGSLIKLADQDWRPSI